MNNPEDDTPSGTVVVLIGAKQTPFDERSP
jgi:hypothetical protein